MIWNGRLCFLTEVLKARSINQYPAMKNKLSMALRVAYLHITGKAHAGASSMRPGSHKYLFNFRAIERFCHHKRRGAASGFCIHIGPRSDQGLHQFD